MENKKPACLICQADSENALSVIRSLGRKKIPIIATATRITAKGLWSKYVSKRIIEPDINKIGLIRYIQWLKRIMKENNVTVFLPTADFLVWIYTKYSKEFEGIIKPPLISTELMDLSLRKDLTYKYCKKYRINCPKTLYPKSKGELKRLYSKGKIKFPIVSKPKITVGIDMEVKGRISKGIFDLLENFKPSKPKKGYTEIFSGKNKKMLLPLIQEFIEGPITQLYTVSTVFNHNHQPISIFCGRKIRQWPVDMGNCTYAESSYNKEAVKEAIKLLKKIKWVGPVEVEIKKDSNDNKFKIIELNPRTYSWTQLAISGGIDLPYWWYELHFKEIPQLNINIKNNIKYRYSLTDICGLPSFLFKSKSKLKFIIEYLKSLISPKINSVFSLKDPKPYFFDFIHALGFIKLYFKRINS